MIIFLALLIPSGHGFATATKPPYTSICFLWLYTLILKNEGESTKLLASKIRYTQPVIRCLVIVRGSLPSTAAATWVLIVRIIDLITGSVCWKTVPPQMNLRLNICCCFFSLKLLLIKIVFTTNYMPRKWYISHFSFPLAFLVVISPALISNLFFFFLRGTKKAIYSFCTFKNMSVIDYL